MARRRQLSGGGTNQALITGARDIAQSKVQGDQRMYDAMDDFEKPFNALYKMGQEEKAAKKAVKDAAAKSEQDLQKLHDANIEKYMKDFNKSYAKIDPEGLNPDQKAVLHDYVSSVRNEYSDIIGKLESGTISQEEKNELNYRKQLSLNKIQRVVADINKMRVDASEFTEEGLKNYSLANYVTNPEMFENFNDNLLGKKPLIINEDGGIDQDLSYQKPAKAEAKYFKDQIEKIRLNVGVDHENMIIPPGKFGENFYSEQKEKFKKSLDNNEALSFMFDDLGINDNGYYRSLENRFTNEGSEYQLLELKMHKDNLKVVDNPSESYKKNQEEAYEYFKDIVAQEQVNGLKLNISQATQIHNAKSQKFLDAEAKANNPDDPGSGTELSDTQIKTNAVSAKISDIFISTIADMNSSGSYINGNYKKVVSSEPFMSKDIEVGDFKDNPKLVTSFLKSLPLNEFKTNKHQLIEDPDKPGDFYIIHAKPNGDFKSNPDETDFDPNQTQDFKLDPSDGLAKIHGYLLGYFKNNMITTTPEFLQK